MPSTDSRTVDGWELYEHGPPDAHHTMLLVPGALASATFFDEVAADPRLNAVHLLATTLPGTPARHHRRMTIPETGHFVVNTHPGRVAELILVDPRGGLLGHKHACVRRIVFR